jgi:hypothetical protein
MSRNGKSLSQDDMLYFNLFIIGLPATPAGKTIGFSNQNLIVHTGTTRPSPMASPSYARRWA